MRPAVRPTSAAPTTEDDSVAAAAALRPDASTAAVAGAAAGGEAAAAPADSGAQDGERGHPEVFGEGDCEVAPEPTSVATKHDSARLPSPGVTRAVVAELRDQDAVVVRGPVDEADAQAHDQCKRAVECLLLLPGAESTGDVRARRDHRDVDAAVSRQEHLAGRGQVGTCRKVDVHRGDDIERWPLGADRRPLERDAALGGTRLQCPMCARARTDLRRRPRGTST